MFDQQVRKNFNNRNARKMPHKIAFKRQMSDKKDKKLPNGLKPKRTTL